MDKELFFRNESLKTLAGFKEQIVEWKDAVLFNKEGEILWPKEISKDYNGYFKQTDEVKSKLKRFIGILNEPDKNMDNNEDYQKQYKTLHRYFYTKGVEFGNKYNLLRLNPPFIIFRDFNTEEGLSIVNIVSKKDKNIKMALAIVSGPEYTAPCVLFYLRLFIFAYNKQYSDDSIEIDDPFNRYSKEEYMNIEF